ncbi:MAG: isoprenylcysteine carboxylmethyltransferase family protein [Chitinophagales bacterium]|nr:isoprenylcysteine carboxylmethyltransferase family protein [Chitinophagales bacterium]
MINLLKHLFSLILPVTVLILVPLWIEDDFSINNIYALIGGSILILAGLLVIVLTISAFIRIGKGTLAPWSPTKKLVVTGIYAHVRNPMISGVLTVLLGESLAILSLSIFIWAIAFFIINNIYFLIYEEPNLGERFGEDYRQYKSKVPRWIPAMKPYQLQH